MIIIKNDSYKFTEEEQQALVTVHGIFNKLWEVAVDSDDQEDYFHAYCVIDSLCEDIPSYIWNPDEREDDEE